MCFYYNTTNDAFFIRYAITTQDMVTFYPMIQCVYFFTVLAFHDFKMYLLNLDAGVFVM